MLNIDPKNWSVLYVHVSILHEGLPTDVALEQHIKYSKSHQERNIENH